MGVDGKLLARAREALEEKKRYKDELYDRRLESVYARAPHIRELDAMIKATITDLIGVALKAADSGQIEAIRLRNLELQEQRLAGIKRAGFPDTYLDDGYMCPKCNDTGYIRTEICDCLLELYKDELKSSLSDLLKLGDETFDNFDLNYYDDTPSKDTMVSPRRSMEVIYETCVEYARKFGGKSLNLFFNGPPGLGKTFLSACIARVVAENGFSVVYDTATSVFMKFEDVRFSRNADDDTRRRMAEESRIEVARRLECDLLILDDLGTEMTTAFTIEALYSLINTRLVSGRKTIVSSNLTLQELGRRYSTQIMSRLEGEYQILTFHGDDIRKKRSAV